MKKSKYPTKTSMNLFYKPDRTTKPSTIALYVLFTLVLLLGLSKWLVYDIWMEKVDAEEVLAAAQEQLNGVMVQLADYNEVRERYIRYSATEEERDMVDRMEILALLDGSVGDAELDVIDINKNEVRVQISDVTLAQTAEIVNRLESSPMVAGTVVNTAATTRETWNGFWYTAVEGWDLVRADILIHLQKAEEGEEAG